MIRFSIPLSLHLHLLSFPGCLGLSLISVGPTTVGSLSQLVSGFPFYLRRCQVRSRWSIHARTFFCVLFDDVACGGAPYVFPMFSWPREARGAEDDDTYMTAQKCLSQISPIAGRPHTGNYHFFFIFHWISISLSFPESNVC